MTLEIRIRPVLLAGLMLALPTLAMADQHAPRSLKSAYADAFLFGATLNRNTIMGGDPKALERVLEHFNAVTPENAMKWERIEPAEGEFDWEAADALVEFAEHNDLYLAGHVLIWHQQTPDWVFQDAEGGPAGRELLLERMENHITVAAASKTGAATYPAAKDAAA